MKRLPPILQHLLGWALCSVIAFSLLWGILHFFQGVHLKPGSLEEAGLGFLLFPMGAAEMICASLHVNVPSMVPFVICCAAWGLVIYGVFLGIRIMRRSHP